MADNEEEKVAAYKSSDFRYMVAADGTLEVYRRAKVTDSAPPRTLQDINRRNAEFWAQRSKG